GSGGAIVLRLREEKGPARLPPGERSRLVRALAAEHGPCGIRVNAVMPGALVPSGDGEWPFDCATPLFIMQEAYRKSTLLGTVVLPEDVAEAVLFLASDRAAKTTGCVVNVDAGLREPVAWQ